MPQQRLVAERRWRLGVQSRGHPSAIVAELLRALRASQVTRSQVIRTCLCARRRLHTVTYLASFGQRSVF